MYNKSSIFFIILYLLSSCNFLSAMESMEGMVILPSKKDLLERLQPIKEYEHFLNNSTFIEKFANKTKYSPEVFMALGLQIDEYRERFKNDRLAFHLEMLKPKVITLMLQDHPDAIAFLKKENVLAEPVLLPSELILHQYLETAGFDYLVKKSHITQQLANQQKYPTEIFMIVDSQVNEYVKKLPNKMAAQAFLALVPHLTKIILQQHPDAINFLIGEQLFE